MKDYYCDKCLDLGCAICEPKTIETEDPYIAIGYFTEKPRGINLKSLRLEEIADKTKDEIMEMLNND